MKFIESNNFVQPQQQQYTANLIKMKSLDDDSGCDELTTAIINSRHVYCIFFIHFFFFIIKF